MRKCAYFSIALVAALSFTAFAAQSNSPAKPFTIAIWPHGAPGEKAPIGPERDITKPTDALVGGRKLIHLTDVSNPTLTVYQPPADKATGAAVVVFPGGGYQILAMDLEGTEICHWLNSIGVTGILLKYRAPSPPGLPNYTHPLEDAQRAVGLVRYHAGAWHIDPNRIGVIGFSAGGNLAAVLSNNYHQRTYPPMGSADNVSCRPNFVMLVYPAYLANPKENYKLAPELKVTSQTPPTFLVQTEDDPVHVENSVYYFLALKNARVPAEMHIYAAGHHGYGLRRTQLTVTTWPERAEQWMRSLGVLKAGSAQ
ncbi:MAG TPA: alpha/beta hydrolase [Terriglobia bacterium]|nr:alpha/beta hydrolase [Terriglobia bacterium]